MQQDCCAAAGGHLPGKEDAASAHTGPRTRGRGSGAGGQLPKITSGTALASPPADGSETGVLQPRAADRGNCHATIRKARADRRCGRSARTNHRGIRRRCRRRGGRGPAVDGTPGIQLSLGRLRDQRPLVPVRVHDGQPPRCGQGRRPRLARPRNAAMRRSSCTASAAWYPPRSPSLRAAGRSAGDTWAGSGTFRISPRLGDRLTLSIYYDQHGHVYLTATDITRHTAQTVRTNVPKILPTSTPGCSRWCTMMCPRLAADTPLWAVHQQPRDHLPRRPRHPRRPVDHQQDNRLHRQHRIRHRYRKPPAPGRHNGGQDFTAWFRALPLAYTDGLAGYEASRRALVPVRVLHAHRDQQPPSPPAPGDVALIWLGQHGATPRAVRDHHGAGRAGGAGSVSYAASYGPRSNAGTFAISPRPGATAWRSASTTTGRATTTSPPATSPRPSPGWPG